MPRPGWFNDVVPRPDSCASGLQCLVLVWRRLARGRGDALQLAVPDPFVWSVVAQRQAPLGRLLDRVLLDLLLDGDVLRLDERMHIARQHCNMHLIQVVLACESTGGPLHVRRHIMTHRVVRLSLSYQPFTAEAPPWLQL